MTPRSRFLRSKVPQVLRSSCERCQLWRRDAIAQKDELAWSAACRTQRMGAYTPLGWVPPNGIHRRSLPHAIVDRYRRSVSLGSEGTPGADLFCAPGQPTAFVATGAGVWPRWIGFRSIRYHSARSRRLRPRRTRRMWRSRYFGLLGGGGGLWSASLCCRRSWQSG